jgi:hypothetical protein
MLFRFILVKTSGNLFGNLLPQPNYVNLSTSAIRIFRHFIASDLTGNFISKRLNVGGRQNHSNSSVNSSTLILEE